MGLILIGSQSGVEDTGLKLADLPMPPNLLPLFPNKTTYLFGLHACESVSGRGQGSQRSEISFSSRSSCRFKLRRCTRKQENKWRNGSYQLHVILFGRSNSLQHPFLEKKENHFGRQLIEPLRWSTCLSKNWKQQVTWWGARVPLYVTISNIRSWQSCVRQQFKLWWNMHLYLLFLIKIETLIVIEI